MMTNDWKHPQYRLLSRQEQPFGLHLYVEPKKPDSACPHCDSELLIAWGGRDQLFSDLPLHGMPVQLHINTKRWRCQSCAKTFTQSLPALAENRKMTQRLLQWVAQQTLVRPFTALASETGVVEGTIRNIFKNRLKELEQTTGFDTPVCMALDEVHFVGKLRCVISNVQTGMVIDILESADAEVLAARLKRLSSKTRVQHVLMGLNTSWRQAVALVLPQAQIVVAKAHIIQLALDAVEQARAGLRNELAPNLRKQLLKDRHLLQVRESELGSMQKMILQSWTNAIPPIGEAYRAKEALLAILDGESLGAAAQQRCAAWGRSVEDAVKPYFSQVLHTISTWQDCMFSNFQDSPIKHCMEIQESIIQALQLQARGHSFQALRARVLFGQQSTGSAILAPSHK